MRQGHIPTPWNVPVPVYFDWCPLSVQCPDTSNVLVALIKDSSWQNWLNVQEPNLVWSRSFQVFGDTGDRSDWLTVEAIPYLAFFSLLKTEYNTHLRNLMRHSHTSPWWDAPGGLKIHCIPVWSETPLSSELWFRTEGTSLKPLRAPTTWVPLSYLTCFTSLLSEALRHEFVSMCQWVGSFSMHRPPCRVSE